MDHHKEVSAKNTITWRAPEFLYKKKTLLWYTNVCIAFFLMALLLVLFKSWLGLGIAIALFAVFLTRANDKPKIVNYRIDITGIRIDDHVITLNDIEFFSVDTTHSDPLIILDLEQTFAMPVSLVVKKEMFEEVADYLANLVPFNTRFSLIRWLTHVLHY